MKYEASYQFGMNVCTPILACTLIWSESVPNLDQVCKVKMSAPVKMWVLTTVSVEYLAFHCKEA